MGRLDAGHHSYHFIRGYELTIDQWATTISGFLAVLLSAGAALRWLVKHYLAELKPNGGGSMNDRLRKLEEKIDCLIERQQEIKIDVEVMKAKYEN